MAVSKRLRFEVFKRDGFTCQYCGRKTPDVVLEADHIIPRVDGGGDEIDNIVTSCFDCNRGKAGNGLDERAPMPTPGEHAAILRERAAQLRAYHAVREELVLERERNYSKCWNYWFEVWGETELNRWETPWKATLRKAVETLGVADVMEAMDITAGKFNYVGSSACKYFGGILRRKIAEYEGRLCSCGICGRPLVLEPGDDPDDGWVHTSCKERSGRG